MSLHLYGPWHTWFAWHPVNTITHGWKWLRQVQRRRWMTNPTYPGPIREGWEYKSWVKGEQNGPKKD